MDRNDKEIEPNAKIQDLDQLEQLMRLRPTRADTAAFFQVGEQTIVDTINRHYDCSFRVFRDKGMVHTRLALVRKAIKMADSGNVTMLIFCLKNICHWADRAMQVDEQNEPYPEPSRPE